MIEQRDIAKSMDKVARTLLGQPNQRLSNRCELRFGAKGSMSVDLRKGTYFDHEVGEGGGVIDLIRREQQCSVRAALSFLETLSPAGSVGGGLETSRALQFKTQDAAMRIWKESLPTAGTLVERYIQGRGLTLSLPAYSIRFHPHCPFGKDEENRQIYLPAMVCLMRSVVTGKGTGVHRTALDPTTGRKSGRKMLGPCEGGAVMLGRRKDRGGELGVCEGIETGLAIMEAGYAPIWATGAAGKLARLPVISGVGKLITWVDYDDAGIAAAVECERRWQRASVPVVRMRPSMPGRDFLDELTAMRAKGGSNVR